MIPMTAPMTMQTANDAVAGHLGAGDGGDQGDGHADDAVDVAAAGGLLIAQATQGQDEQDAGGDIGRWSIDPSVIVQLPLFPEHLQHALGDEKTAEHVDGGDQYGDRRQYPRPGVSRLDTCSRAPMTMMPLMALVTLMSGVCRAGVTFQITM